MRLRQTVMLLNRAIRSCIGCNISSLLPFQPFLDDEIQQLLPSAEAQQQQEGQEAGTTLGGGVVEEEAKAEGNTGKQVEAQGDEQHGILSQVRHRGATWMS